MNATTNRGSLTWLPTAQLLFVVTASVINVCAPLTSEAQRNTRCAFMTSLPLSRTRTEIRRPPYSKLHSSSISSSTDSTSSGSNARGVVRKRGKSKKSVNVSHLPTSSSTAAPEDEMLFVEEDAHLDELFEALSSQKKPLSDDVKLVDFIEQNIGIQEKKPINKLSAPNHEGTTIQSTSIEDNPSSVHTVPIDHSSIIMEEQPPPSVTEKIGSPYNVVCTHITADFDTLASAIGLARLWSLGIYTDEECEQQKQQQISDENSAIPTYVVLPRGAHPDVSRFLSLHKHLFPIRSLKSLPGMMDDTSDNSGGLQRVGLVDAQRRDRLGPADILLEKASRGVTIVDHHVDAESDIESRHYIVENVGSVSTMIAERLKRNGVRLTEAEATVLALGIHSDTGSLVYDSTTAKDASMLGWCMELGASQSAIAEHAKPTLSDEQQRVLTQSLVNLNTTNVHGVTISTVLLSADGFISGLASVAKDALDLSSSDVFLLAVCYEATRSGGKSKAKSNDSQSALQKAKRSTVKALSNESTQKSNLMSQMINSESWKGGEAAFQRQRLASNFAIHDLDGSGFLDRKEIEQALRESGYLISNDNLNAMIDSIDENSDGKISFDEFVNFYAMEERRQLQESMEIEDKTAKPPQTMTIIGRVKAGVNVRNVNLNKLFQQFNGGGHPKAASATAKVADEKEASEVLQRLVDELIDKGLAKQLMVGDFMQSPVLSAKPTMTEVQVEDLFVRYDVRALPVVNDNNEVIGLVSYKEVTAAKQRLLNKQEKRLRQMEKAAENGKPLPEGRPLESALKGWMKQHVQIVEASTTMSEVEQILLDTDVGCIPVVADNTKHLIGMVTRTDLLRQHRYYQSLHYHNKGFSDSIAARKPIIELRKKLKKFDIENE